MRSRSPSFAKQRMLWTRLLIAALAAYMLTSAPPTWLAVYLADVSELIGFILLSVAGLGRLWCLLFIGGKKNAQLITHGPYSVVRNPLYVFSFLGLIGFGLAIKNPALALLLGMLFAVLYPAVANREEAHLRHLYGESFDRYCASTPRWIPRLRLYHEPPFIVVSTASIRAAMLNATGFLLAFLLWEMIEEFRKWGYLTTLF